MSSSSISPNIMDTSDGGNNNTTGSLRDRQFELLQQLSLQIIQLVAKNNAENPNNNSNGVVIQLLRQLIEQSLPSLGSQQSQQQQNPGPISGSNAAGLNGSTMPYRSSGTGTSSGNQFGTGMTNGTPTASRGTQGNHGMQQGVGLQSQQGVGNQPQGDGNSELMARLRQLLAVQNQGSSTSGGSTVATGGATADTQSSSMFSQASQAASSSSIAPSIQQQQQQQPYSNTNTNLTPNLFGQLVPQQPRVAQPQPQQAPPAVDAVSALISLLQNASGQNAAAANPNHEFRPVAQQQQHAIREVNVPMGYPMTNIEFPGPHDVVLGRGRGASGHIGNVKFRAFIKRYKPKYAAANRIDKPKVAEEVVAKWRVKTPPGRFLVQVRTTDRNVWNDVGDRKARQKTSQSLREKEMTREEQQRQQQRRNRRDGGSAEISGDSTSIASTGGSTESDTEGQTSSGSDGACQERTSADGSSGQEQATQNTVRVSMGSSGSSGSAAAESG